MAKVTTTMHYKVTTAILTERGIPFEVEHGGKHPRLRFTLAGRTMRFGLPSTPGDCRGHREAEARMRRVVRDAEALGGTRVA